MKLCEIARMRHVALLILFWASTSFAYAQDAMFVDSTGNVGVGTNTPAYPLHIYRGDGSTAGLIVQREGGTARAVRSIWLLNNGSPLLRMKDTSIPLVWDFRLFANGFSADNPNATGLEMSVDNGGNMTLKGTLTQGSSRSFKQNLATVSANAVLSKLDVLPISEWSYKFDANVRHVGPMAEDFYSTFQLGADDKHIAPGDMAGLALAASKGLLEQVDQIKAENGKLAAENERMKARMQQIEARLDKLANQ